MEIKLKYGIGDLIFGMKVPDVELRYGKPDLHFVDDDENEILVYNAPRFRLTFYEEEDFRLGFIAVSHPDLTVHGVTLIGRQVEEVKVDLMPKGLKTWEKESFDVTTLYFNETNWFWLQTEFGVVVKVEFGVGMKEKDDSFDWKFKA